MTNLLPIWYNTKTGLPVESILNPWVKRGTVHVKYPNTHIAWAENIHNNIVNKTLEKPATFDWHDKVVYIVGHGEGLDDQTREILERPRSNPAIFLNHSAMSVKYQPGDYALIFDSGMMWNDWLDDRVAGLPLITFPGIEQSIFDFPWSDVYGVTFWTQKPFNNWMRRAYPLHPQVMDCRSIAVSAPHLAALNGAKAVVLIGQEYTISQRYNLLGCIGNQGTEVTSTKQYMMVAMAVSSICQFANAHTGMRIISTSKGLSGVNLFPEPNVERPSLFKHFEFRTLEDVYNEFEKE